MENFRELSPKDETIAVLELIAKSDKDRFYHKARYGLVPFVYENADFSKALCDIKIAEKRKEINETYRSKAAAYHVDLASLGYILHRDYPELADSTAEERLDKLGGYPKPYQIMQKDLDTLNAQHFSEVKRTGAIVGLSGMGIMVSYTETMQATNNFGLSLGAGILGGIVAGMTVQNVANLVSPLPKTENSIITEAKRKQLKNELEEFKDTSIAIEALWHRNAEAFDASPDIAFHAERLLVTHLINKPYLF